MFSCSFGQSPEDQYLTMRNRAIEKELLESKKEIQEADKNSIKVLLLGAGESGKSTILKQMKLMNNIQFTDEEIATFRAAIRFNILTCAKTLISAMDKLYIPYGFEWSADNNIDCEGHVEVSKIEKTPLTSRRESNLPPSVQAIVNGYSGTSSQFENQEDIESSRSLKTRSVGANSQQVTTINDIPLSATIYHMKRYTWGNDGVPFEADDEVAMRAFEEYIERQDKNPPVYADDVATFPLAENLTSQVVAAIKKLWADTGIQYCVSRANEFQLMDCCEYVMKNIDRIADFEYKPTEEDILKARVKTTGVTETVIRVNAAKVLRVYDLGGQRTERRKWAAHFENVSSIIFLIAISEYHTMCAEDNDTNRMVESLNVFGAISSHPLFLKLPIMVFLNKIDLFKQRLKHFPISATFPSYKGPNTFEEGCKYFSQRVSDINKVPDRTIYIHFTWATDKTQVRTVLSMVQDILINQGLTDFGII